MCRLVFAVALACAVSGSFATAAQPAAPLVKDTAPIALFNGKDLTGLQVFSETGDVYPTAHWKVEDGVLRCLGHGRGYIRTTTAYGDYTLRLEWRWPARPGNSGVLLHLVGPDLIWPKSFEAQLAAGRAGDFATFSDARSNEEIISRNPSGVSTGRLNRSASSAVEKTPGEWNTYEIVVAGDTITTGVNGVTVNRMTGVRPSGGMIALQNEGTPINFRSVELTPLPPAKDLNAPMPR